jgi:hypothetical protein
MKEGEAIVHPWVNKSLERAQAKVEGRNFDIRKQLLKFDDVMNDQRKVDLRPAPRDHGRRGSPRSRGHAPPGDRRPDRHPHAAPILCRSMGHRGPDAAVKETLGLDLPIADWADEEGVDDEVVRERLETKADEYMASKAAQFGPSRCATSKSRSCCRPSTEVARTSADAGTPALCRGLPRLCPARSAERVQDRVLPAVRRDARQPAIGCQQQARPDPAAHARATGRDHPPASGAAGRAAKTAGNRRYQRGPVRPRPLQTRPRRWSRGSTKTIPRLGAIRAATIHAPADRARSSSIATERRSRGSWRRKNW